MILYEAECQLQSGKLGPAQQLAMKVAATASNSPPRLCRAYCLSSYNQTSSSEGLVLTTTRASGTTVYMVVSTASSLVQVDGLGAAGACYSPETGAAASHCVVAVVSFARGVQLVHQPRCTVAEQQLSATTASVPGQGRHDRLRIRMTTVVPAFYRGVVAIELQAAAEARRTLEKYPGT